MLALLLAPTWAPAQPDDSEPSSSDNAEQKAFTNQDNFGGPKTIGAQLELSAVEFYRGEAKKADDPEVASLFDVLADWEARHYKALLDQQNVLKADYWTEGRFSPF